MKYFWQKILEKCRYPFLVWLFSSFIFASWVYAVDDWVQVLRGGNGLRERRTAHAMIIYGDYIYVASGEPDSSGGIRPRIFRATIRDDTVWREFSPPWRVAGEVTDMEIMRGKLYVGTSGGELWRLNERDVWTRIGTPWEGEGILSMGTFFRLDKWRRVLGVSLGRGDTKQLEIWYYNEDDGWRRLSRPRLEGVESSRMHDFGSWLYVGIGGGSAGSRVAEVWRYIMKDTWDPVTTDGFGNPDLTWITSMEYFNHWLYIGTAGHGDNVPIYRTNRRDLEDVTPYSLYDFSRTGNSPVRYGSMAVASWVLYVGTRTRTLPGEAIGADVIAINAAGEWAISNEPGFGVRGNDTTTALASMNAYLYAGTFNGISGFEVWRRTPTLLELMPFILGDLAKLTNLIPSPWDMSWEWDYNIQLRPIYIRQFMAPMESIEMALEKARHPDDNTNLLNSIRKRMEKASKQIKRAELLANLAEQSPKKAYWLRKLAMSYVIQAVNTAKDAVSQVLLNTHFSIQQERDINKILHKPISNNSGKKN